MNANWFIFFQKEVVSTSIRQLIDFLDHVGRAHQSISLFLDAFRASSISQYWFRWSKEVVSTSVKNYSRMKATDDMIGAVRRFRNLDSIWPYLNDKIQEKELRQFFCLNSFLGCSTTISFYLDPFV